MKVWVVVEHYDIGSDEFAVRGVFSTSEKALKYLKREYKGWQPFLYEGETAESNGGEHNLTYYQDGVEEDAWDPPTESNRVWIEEQEVQ